MHNTLLQHQKNIRPNYEGDVLLYTETSAVRREVTVVIHVKLALVLAGCLVLHLGYWVKFLGLMAYMRWSFKIVWHVVKSASALAEGGPALESG